jgi:CubicO group peptidase (beta-lactamase class C family)
VLDHVGDQNRSFRIASITKVLTAWATMVAVEEGIVSLDQAEGQPGCTLRHLLAHAGGYAFDGDEPIAAPGRQRIYSNTGIELAAAAVERAAGMPFATYLAEAILQPLGMTATELRGSPAHGAHSTVADLARFVGELIAPRLISAAAATEATTTAYPGLSGRIPGIGRFGDCAWGLGIEVKAAKSPHWTADANSPATFGHFGGAGTFIWVDPHGAWTRTVACIALTDRPFDDWRAEALVRWPELSDAVLAQVREQPSEAV